MAKVTFHQGDEILKTVTLKKGQTILRAAKQGRVALKHRCGGNAQCTTCKVTIVDQSAVSTPQKKEVMTLGEHNIAQDMRLSCQTRVHGKVDVVVPEDPYKARIRALLAQEKP